MSADAHWSKLRRVSDELRQLSETVARSLESAEGLPARSTHLPPAQNGLDLDADYIRKIIRVRRSRERFFDRDLFADPAWDIMLTLLEAEIRQVRTTITSLCESAAVPNTTALRWISILTEKGIVVRRNDPHDGRRIFAELSTESSRNLRQFFAEAAEQPI